MLINTIKAHPLLKQLYISSDHAIPNNLFGLNAKQLKVSKSSDSEYYYIGVEELVTIFKDRCAAGDINAINAFLNFDYKTLAVFPAHHPFYVRKNPFTRDFLLEQITEANYLNQKDVSLHIQSHIKEWLNSQLESKEDSLFSSSVATAVHVVSVFQPNLAFRRLAEALSQTFVLTNAIYNNRNYYLVLESLEGIAIYPEYFILLAGLC